MMVLLESQTVGSVPRATRPRCAAAAAAIVAASPESHIFPLSRGACTVQHMVAPTCQPRPGQARRRRAGVGPTARRSRHLPFSR